MDSKLKGSRTTFKTHTGNTGQTAMSCVEKRHAGHRAGSMLHHRFPNGFTELLMDDTDREVSTLTDRAFRSICIGDDAVCVDEFSCGLSPFSCHKPLVEEPRRKSHPKESKKQGQHRGRGAAKDATRAAWSQQQQQDMTRVSSFLKALSATEKGCEGMFKNGDVKDSNGESWDRSALRSIQKELSEFSSDYHNTLADGHFSRSNHHHHHHHPSGEGSAKKTGKDNSLLSGKSSKNKNGKSTLKLRKLNIKNFFLHSEFSPFQMWKDINQFPFGQEEIFTSVPTDKIPKWYDSLLYKELAEAHRIDLLHRQETQPCQTQEALAEPSLSTEEAESLQNAVADLPPPPASQPIPRPPPPKVLPKPTASLAEKRCSSNGAEGNVAPWRRNKSRSKSTLPVNQPGVFSPPQERNSETVEENVSQVKGEAKCVEVKAIEEVNSLASTPFSICQLMTPLIPSRQPTETSEILQVSLDLPLRPDSEAKLTPELPVKRESYRSLASSILFNLKDNRKRVKSRYSPPKFKTSELPECGKRSPRLDNGSTHMGSEGSASGFSTPAIIKDGRTCCSPVLKQSDTPTVVPAKGDFASPSSDDYLISNLLQTKRDVAGSSSLGEDNHFTPLMQSKINGSPMANKINYPSLNLYKKESAESFPPENRRHLSEQSKELLLNAAPRHILSNTEAVNTSLSPNIVQRLSPKVAPVSKDVLPLIKEKQGLSQSGLVNKPNLLENTHMSVREDFTQLTAVDEKDTGIQPLSTADVIKAARDAINAAKHKALAVGQSDYIKKTVSDTSQPRERLKEENITKVRHALVTDVHLLCPQNKTEEINNAIDTDNDVKREPPPVPKRNFTKSDIKPALDKQKPADLADDGSYVTALSHAKKDSPPSNEREFVKKEGRLKHRFSARQNNYIKSQRYAVADNDHEEESNAGETKAKAGLGKNDGMLKDSEHIINDLQALKELERARRGDGVLENGKDKRGSINIDEEAKAKNDLISRELRNIKRGMLSMRGNTQAKRDMFAKKESEQSKRGIFTKIDNNVIVNKALLNDNYDRAKMALEEIISERLKNKSTKEQDGQPSEDSAGGGSYASRLTQREAESPISAKKTQNARVLAQGDNELRERLGDLRDHNHMRYILSQTEATFGEPHRLDAKIPQPGMNTVSRELSKPENATDDISQIPELELKNNIVGLISDNNGGNQSNETKENKKTDVPPVPPRNKKGMVRRDEMNTTELESAVGQLLNEDSKKAETVPIKEIATDSRRQEEVSDVLTETLGQIKNVANNEPAEGDSILSEHTMSSEARTKDEHLCASPREERCNEIKTDSKGSHLSPEGRCETGGSLEPQEQRKVKRKAPPRPHDVKAAEHLRQESSVHAENTPGDHLMAEDSDMLTTQAEVVLDLDASIEVPRDVISPLLLVNGLSLNQSPPDQASMSSKSSYFSAESALHRNLSLENLTAELEEINGESTNVLGNLSGSKGKEQISGSDHERETDVCKQPLHSPYKEREEPHEEILEHGSNEVDNVISSQLSIVEINHVTPMSPKSTFSPTMEMPALFRVKDNKFCNKTVKPVQPWLPKQNLNGSEMDKLLHSKSNLGLPFSNETAITCITSDNPPEDLATQNSPLAISSPSSLLNENLNNSRFGPSLTVPQEEDAHSGVSPSSEGVESLAASTAGTGDGVVSSIAVTEDGSEVSKVPSERSGSTCSANDNQTGPSKPPLVLPKSEKALLKAMKLTNRRIKKEEAQNKPSQKASHSSRKQRATKHGTDKLENKPTEDRTLISSSRHGEKHSGEKEHRRKTERRNHHTESSHSHGKNKTEQAHFGNRDHSGHRQDHGLLDRSSYETETQIQDRAEIAGRCDDRLPHVSTEREGRSSDRGNQEKPEHRNYSSDRVFSNVPVYKAHISERPMGDRQFKRSQSIDRYVGGHAERRASADMSADDRLESRNQRIEKSIMDELQQRGRARDRTGRDGAMKRSRSIDTHVSEISHPSNLSPQSSHNSQLSRQSSIEHTIVAQSIPMTQRKLLQDPDSGQYFFVDMPIQVKTKTFFDPETGNYVQLPVQPPEGAIAQASTVDVLNPPLVLYHGFVPVPLPSITHKSVIQASHMEQEEFERRQNERSRPLYSNEGHPYLEPVYGQHEHMLGDFLGTEELDCAS